MDAPRKLKTIKKPGKNYSFSDHSDTFHNRLSGSSVPTEESFEDEMFLFPMTPISV